LREETRKAHKHDQSGQPVSGPKFESGTSRTRNRSANHVKATFSLQKLYRERNYDVFHRTIHEEKREGMSS